MKTIVAIALIMISSVGVYSQKAITLKGKTTFDLEYYFDNNVDSKMTVKRINNIYELVIPKKTKFKEITIYEQGNDDCTQKLIINNLLRYSKSLKIDTITNDATHISSCFRMEIMAAPEYEKFLGKWGYADFELYVYNDGEFYLKYTKDNFQYQKEGWSRINNNTLLLQTQTIKNNLTETYTDNIETIQFDLKNGVLISEKLNVELKKIN
jgi:hypothetical protein